MKQLSKFFAAFALLAALMTGCEKDDLNKLSENTEVVLSGDVQKPAVIDGQTMIFNLPKNNLKGLFTDETSSGTNIEQQIIKDYPYTTAANSYRVIKVVRPDGRYFWIMIDNYKYNTGSGCYTYGNNTSNLATYGRLYTWTMASSVAATNRIYMKLPRIVNGVPSSPIYTVYGRLPKFQDIKDLFESTVIGNLPSNGTNPSDPLFDPNNANPKFYYDAFLAGREEAFGDYTKAYPSLAGWRDTYPTGSNQYYQLNQKGQFWTAELAVTGAHYPLSIAGEVDDHSAYINVGHSDAFGFSVRYVFEPIYQ